MASVAIVGLFFAISWRDTSATTPSLLGPAFFACNGHGHTCDIGGQYGHFIHPDLSDLNAAAPPGNFHGDCQYGQWDTIHSCDPEDSESLRVSDALAALKSGDLGSPSQLASKYPKTVSLNLAIGEIQVRDCKGKVAALIPLTDRSLGTASF
jgi:hypothetical protein